MTIPGETPAEIEQYWREVAEHGTVRWFGEDWHAPVNTPQTRIEVPVGAMCYCVQSIEAKDSGIRIPHASLSGGPDFTYYHRACWMMSILGTHSNWRDL